MYKLIEDLNLKISSLAKITIGSAGVGTLPEFFNNLMFVKILVNTDLLSIFQYVAYIISMTVGILTIVTWFRKNRKEKK